MEIYHIDLHGVRMVKQISFQLTMEQWGYFQENYFLVTVTTYPDKVPLSSLHRPAPKEALYCSG